MNNYDTLAFSTLSVEELQDINGGSLLVDIIIGLVGCAFYYGASNLVYKKTGKQIHQWAAIGITEALDKILPILKGVFY